MLLLWPVLAVAASGTNIFSEIRLEQKLGEPLPLELTFRNESGKAVALREHFKDQPVLLALVYFECPMLCQEVMSGLLRTLRGITFDAGREFTVVLVSIDPRETPVVAARAKETWLRKYDRPGSEAGWNFLTGEEATIKALAKAVGYHYRYDAERDQFAHPAGIMIATPEGKLARYFYGLQYPPRDVRLGIIEASDRKIAAPADQVLLLCMQYDPATGQYGLAIVRAVRAGGVVTLAVLIYLILGMVRQERAKLRRVQR